MVLPCGSSPNRVTYSPVWIIPPVHLVLWSICGIFKLPMLEHHLLKFHDQMKKSKLPVLCLCNTSSVKPRSAAIEKAFFQLMLLRKLT
ncbi:uncharacterized protein PHALS_15280 [Plasmopara halstedii]|uniref:Uncharacterized protein n=1 Tax=Plasmopara halstedii TaxID=4781 RepID=A0A0P1B8W3_PLAHL|nr:uncharacterized protein PHALS_15280 [Plasmopara halstedii]CEG50282.1 hypothetical protein PHALS_15280 [Plasmopara halstedii]|eukprot:XP_024586651.1 hypothetical protein PHALS_15280 [Plasmopara halstedii]